MRKFLTAFLFLVSFSAFAQKADTFDLNAAPPKDPSILYGELPNGLRYYIRKNNKPENRAELRLAVKVGSTMEDDDQQGLAHFLEHMAFNGTKHFPKNDLVNYLESIGTKFGPHLNAYTSFDETVYMLQVPTDSAIFMEKGLQILRDWATDISFDSLEIEKERGVVIEEWRLRLGAGERMRRQYWPVLYGGSRYAERLPIGKKEILDTFSHATLKRFYSQYYRPDHMALVIVGNIDPKAIEAKIMGQFGNIPKPVKPSNVTLWPLPDRDSLSIAVAADKENTYTMIQHSYRHPNRKNESNGDYRIGLVYGLISSMLNARLQERINSPEPPMVYGYSYYGNLLRTKDAFTTFGMVQADGIEKGLKTMIEEHERVKRHGFTESELKRAKTELMRYYEEAIKEKDKVESVNYTYEYINNFLENEPIPGVEYEMALVKKYFPFITLTEINRVAAALITPNKNETLLVTGIEKEGVKMPTTAALKDLIKRTRSASITAYVDNMPEGELMTEKLTPVSASATRDNPTLGTNEWGLPNGIKVILKTTDFKNNEILMSATMPGGISNLPNDKLHDATMASTVITESGIANFTKPQLDKYLTGKMLYVYPQIGNHEIGFYGSTTTEDLELMLQMAYQYVRNPRKDAELFKAIIKKQKTWYEDRERSPNAAYADTINATMSSYNPRTRPMKAADFDRMKLDEIFKIYTDQFSSFNGMTFIFVGNTTEQVLRPLTEKYLGNLPGGKAGQWKDNNIRPPKGVLEKTVVKGVEPKSSVRIQYTGEFVWNYANRIKYNALMQLANIKLRESLREDEGGTYGVGVYGNPAKIPYQHYNLIVSFGCSPDSREKLASLALEVIENIKQKGADDKDLKKIKETMLREMETKRKENEHWLGAIEALIENGDNAEDLKQFESLVNGLKGSDFKTLAAQYFNNANRASFYLVPENH